MQKMFSPILVCLLALLASCSGTHLISDAAVRNQVNADYESQASVFNQDFLDVNGEELTAMEEDAMRFLYAYLPIGDVTDYTNDFYLSNIRASFKAKEEMPWGAIVPEELFLHFVLPIRVNNENLDESRMVFYEELKDRVKNLSLYDAVLEVNHWCHEKVIYTPSDARTSSPLASVRTAYGRCGEESTFTVAALRSVGIPARQVYAPRWAHSDNNHAWVEAWVDGKWYFLGACEPEPVLNLGWFNAPASRGMLMHTKVFGKYNGPEEVMAATEGYTEINLIENYAPAARAIVKVVDEAGNPVEGADVAFQIYNYAEYFNVCTKQTDSKGECFLTAGKGDLMAWVTKDGKFGYSKVSFGVQDVVTIVLDKKPGYKGIDKLDIVPPVESAVLPEVSSEQRAENTRRMKEEDVIRTEYTKSFFNKEKATLLAKELGTDPVLTSEVMLASRGNYPAIKDFLTKTPAERRPEALELLRTIAEKDIRDTPSSVLLDHLNNTPRSDSKLYMQYIANPRVAYEMLTPYKAVLNKGLSSETKGDPKALVEWVKKNIRMMNEKNELRIPIMPTGVFKSRIADDHSRDIFFVAAARSLGIAARIEPVAKTVQYAENDNWIDVNFGDAKKEVAQSGTLSAEYKANKTLDNPKYYTHFTIAKMHDDGKLQTLRFERNKAADMGAGSTWKGLLDEPMEFDAGNYVMISGTRMANGSVLAQMNFFSVEPGKHTETELVMRESSNDVQVIGAFNSELKFSTLDGKQQSFLQTTGRGYYVAAILGSRQEPTNHAMRDLVAFKNELEEWNRGIVLLFPDEANAERFDANEFGTLPSTITYGIDTDGAATSEMIKNMKLKNKDNLPIFIIADTFNRVVFVSQGYQIGLAEQMMKVINKL